MNNWHTRRALRLTLAGVLLGSLALDAAAFDVQGHRGARGLAPENTLPAFRQALALGVSTLECDMAITRDGEVVLHHDIWLNPDTTRGPDGRWLEARGPAVHELTFTELQTYDVGRLRPGTRYAADFPDQQPADGTRVPRLADLFALLKQPGNEKVQVDCETKVSPLDPQATLGPAEFARRVIAEVRAHGMEQRFMIQSFDWRTLQVVQAEAPEIRTLYLSSPRTLAPLPDGRPSPWLAGFAPEAHGGSVPQAVRAAGGTLWAPNQSFVTPERLAEAHRLGIKVIPYTVNDEPTMIRLIDMGVDGLISDRPDRLMQVLQTRRAAR